MSVVMAGIVLLVSVCFERWHRLGESPYFRDSEQSLASLALIILLGGIAFMMVPSLLPPNPAQKTPFGRSGLNSKSSKKRQR